MPRPLISYVGDQAEVRNWQEVVTAFRDLSPVAESKMTPFIDLVTGDNEIPLPRGVPNPLGRLVIFQDSASTVLDVGLRNGRWVVNASAPTRIRFLFF